MVVPSARALPPRPGKGREGEWEGVREGGKREVSKSPSLARGGAPAAAGAARFALAHSGRLPYLAGCVRRSCVCECVCVCVCVCVRACVRAIFIL